MKKDLQDGVHYTYFTLQPAHFFEGKLTTHVLLQAMIKPPQTEPYCQ